MFPQFATTSDTFTRASSMVFRMGSDGHLYDDPQDANIESLLDSKFDTEKAEALKRLLALMSQGCDVSNFFPQVVKNVASPSLEIKKLVYIYLVHYAERRPDEALLPINSFQKDLSDLNPLVRAWALRAMSGIRVHVVAPLVLMAVNKGARDPSPYVRRCAANAIPKLYDLERDEHDTALQELIGLLLNDKCAGVIGAAAAAYNVVCPDNLTLIGSNFKKLCQTLPDVEEWGQIILIEILLRYAVAKHGISKMSAALNSGYTKRLNIETENSDSSSEGIMNHGVGRSSASKGDEGHKIEGKGLVSSYLRYDQQKKLSRTSSLSSDSSESNYTISTIELHSDLKLLLQCTSPLLWSQNSGVVVAAAGVHWLMAPVKDVRRIVKPLLFLLRSSYDSQYVVLSNLATFVRAMPSLFEPYYEDFFVRSSDTYQMRAIKLDILSLIATELSIDTILLEFQDYIRDPDRKFAADAVSAIGRCAKRLPAVALTCLKGLLALVRQISIALRGSNCPGNEETADAEETADSRKKKFPGVKADLIFRADWMLSGGDKTNREASVLTQAILAIKTILREHPVELEKVFVQLIQSLDLIKVPTARAVVIWMVGEYSSTGDLIPKIVPTILKYLGACFPTEGSEAKLQILNCVAKVVLHSQAIDRNIILLVANYVLDMGKCDLSYDVRDRAHMLQKLLASYLSGVGLDERNHAPQSSEGGEHVVLVDLPGPAGVESEKSQDISIKHAVGETSLSQQELHANLLPALAKNVLLSPKLATLLHSASNVRLYLPGSLSHIVQHRAPGYRHLPKPGSLCQIHIHQTNEVRHPTALKGKARANGQNSSADIIDNTSLSSDGSFSEGSLHGRESGTDEELDQSNASEGSDLEIMCKDRSRYSSTSSTRNSCVKSRASESNNKTSKDVEGKSKEGDQRRIEPLIYLSDGEHGKDKEVDCHDLSVVSDSLPLMCQDALESWLGPDVPVSGPCSSAKRSMLSGYANLSVGTVDRELRKYTLLDFTNGDGMNVMYAFSNEHSGYSPMMVCIRLFFYNRSSNAIFNIIVKADESTESPVEPGAPATEVHDQLLVSSEPPRVIPMQEIPCLGPGQTIEAELYVSFHHQLVPLKLGVYCNNRCYSVRLRPEIGALLRPLSMNVAAFTSKESQMSGMLENSRRCTFREHLQMPSDVNDSQLQHDDKLVCVARTIVSRILSRFHVSVVAVTIPIFTSFMDQSGGHGDVQGLCLRFSSETLSGFTPCLITVTAEECYSGTELPVLVKINCEDAVFGLNLLKRLVEVLTESQS